MGSMLPATQITKVTSGDRPNQFPTWHDSRRAADCGPSGQSRGSGPGSGPRRRTGTPPRSSTAGAIEIRRSTAQSGSPVPAASAHSARPRHMCTWRGQQASARLKNRAIFWPRWRCSPAEVTDASARVGIAITELATNTASQGRARATRAGGVVQSCSGVQRALCCCADSGRCAARKPATVSMQQNTASAKRDTLKMRSTMAKGTAQEAKVQELSRVCSVRAIEVVSEGGTGKTAFSPVRPHIFASVECSGLYFNRTHHAQNLLLKKQRTRDICTANTLNTQH